MDFLLSPIWAIIAAIAAVIIIPITIRLRERKVLAYEVIANTTILSVQEGKYVKGRVQVLLDNKPVRNVQIVVLRIWNSGNAPIKREDFDNHNPIEVDLGKEAEVLEAEVLETIPNNIEAEVKASLKIDSGSVKITPILFNSQNSIKLR